MNIQAIVVSNCTGIIMLIVLFISSRFVRHRSTLSDRLFTALMAITASACFTEMMSFILDGSDLSHIRYPLILINSYLYVCNMAVSFIWCLYVDLRLYSSTERIKKMYKWIGIPSQIGIAGIIVNIFVPFIFRIDAANHYERMPLGYIYYGIAILYLGYSLVMLIDYYIKYGKNKFFPMLMFMMPICIGMTVQLFIYGVSIVWCSVAIGLIGIHMSLQNELSYIDPLTKLYNRNYLENVLEIYSRRGDTAGGLMIDIDYFKSINDKYGHSAGDLALEDAAEIIRGSVPTKAVCIRFAGDEFIILFRTDSENEISETAMKLRNAVQGFNENSDRQYQLSFSIGCAMIDENCSADELLGSMDAAMYSEKRAKHCRSAIKEEELRVNV